MNFVLVHTFSPGDFTISKWGGCRINPHMAGRLAEQLMALNTENAAKSFSKWLAS